MKSPIICHAAVLVALAAPLHANSIITWGPAQTISGDTDVSTVGTLVGAYNLGAPAGGPSGGVATDTTVNGVTFVAFPISGVTSATAGNFTLSSLLTSSLNGDNSVLADGPFGLSTQYKALIGSGVSSGLG